MFKLRFLNYYFCFPKTLLAQSKCVYQVIFLFAKSNHVYCDQSVAGPGGARRIMLVIAASCQVAMNIWRHFAGMHLAVPARRCLRLVHLHKHIVRAIEHLGVPIYYTLTALNHHIYILPTLFCLEKLPPILGTGLLLSCVSNMHYPTAQQQLIGTPCLRMPTFNLCNTVFHYRNSDTKHSRVHHWKPMPLVWENPTSLNS